MEREIAACKGIKFLRSFLNSVTELRFSANEHHHHLPR